MGEGTPSPVFAALVASGSWLDWIFEVKLQISSTKLLALVLLAAGTVSAQVAAHAPSAVKAAMSAPATAPKPVARVNGTVLNENDLLREMYAIFPYARQHNGFPKSMEAEIRKGALQMIIFEELLYQEAKRRKMTVLPARMARAEANFRKQFPSEAIFQQYLQGEHNGSRAAYREKIRRSLLIEQMLKMEVTAKSRVTPAEVRAYYDKNPKQFTHGESFHIQTISLIPPDGSPQNVKEARKRAEEVFAKAKAAKDYREFGLLAESASDDDWHVNMGDRKTVEAEKLPPPVVKVLRGMKAGQVSELIQLGDAYTIVRLVEHTPAGKTPFEKVKSKLQADMAKEKTEKVRSALGARLRQNAKIEML
jgi:peptidyl-prolyl cis-trans isomerase SurA